MNRIRFDNFFRAATGNTPYLYQCRLACGDPPAGANCDLTNPDEATKRWLSDSDPNGCRSRLINIPTGLGKTAAVVLAWLWNRVAPQIENRKSEIENGSWPRRLVYCLPMRTLVEQTRDNARLWILRLALAATEDRSTERTKIDAEIERHAASIESEEARKHWLAAVRATWGDDERAVEEAFANDLAHARDDLVWLATRSPVILMGGEDVDRDWDVCPEKSAILIGTQDMLLSRVLNRGYGMSRYRWPMQFGLLHTDCLWVFDEIQLMGSGLATTAQLEAFRGRNGCASFWMSATLQKDWLKTVDFADRLPALPLVKLEEEDLQSREVRQRREARKPIQPAKAGMDDSAVLAAEILTAHQRAGGRTLVVINTVKRARELSRQLERVTKSAESKPELVLIHSRFRPNDRRRQVDRLLAEPGEQGMIVISTQVVEAGVDVSARTLFTELAPWASLVQRFGRSNRRGKENDKAQVFWIGLPADDRQHDRFSAPYRTAELLKSRELLQAPQRDVGPASLPQDVALPYERGQVLRRKNFIELFDTTPDLAGNDIDVDRYVREVQESDVQVFWREWPAHQSPSSDTPGPRREELCAVPVGEFRDFVKDTARRKLVYRWDYLDEEWLPVETNRIFPGQVYLLHAKTGGYTTESGWDAKSSEKVEVLPAPQPTPPPDANDADSLSESAWQSIAQHTDRVCCELEDILSKLDIAEAMPLKAAARWHDRGKAHSSFVAKLKPDALATARTARLLNGEFPAKAPNRAWIRGQNKNADYRKHFRHELASALAVLMVGGDQIAEDARDLVAYLVAAHHGKVRLSIRSLPEETVPPAECRFARGVWDDDALPQADLGGGVSAPAVKLSLEPMELGLCEKAPFAGHPSWADRMLRLRDKLGPFRLAYLEAILRAADIRASRDNSPPEANNV